MVENQRSGVGTCEGIYAMYQRQCAFSTELRELLDAMLAIDPARRLTMQQVAEHRWFATVQGEADDGDEVMYPVARRF